MKAKSPTALIALLIAALSSGSARQSWAEDGTTQTTGVPADSSGLAARDHPDIVKEDLGYDIFGGKTNKIARVSSENPAWVYVIYEGGTSGRNIPRENQPPQLQAKYPYDPAKAAEYQRKQSETKARREAADAQQAATARGAAADAAYRNLYRNEQQLQAEIARLQSQDVELQTQIERAKDLPLGRTRRDVLAKLGEEQRAVRDRILQLKVQVEQIRVQRDAIPKTKTTILAEIEELQNRDATLQKEIDRWSSLPAGNGRNIRLTQLKGEQKDVRGRLKQLMKQVLDTPTQK